MAHPTLGDRVAAHLQQIDELLHQAGNVLNVAEGPYRVAVLDIEAVLEATREDLAYTYIAMKQIEASWHAPTVPAGPFRVQLVPDPLRPEWSWEIYAPEQPIAISARPFSTPKEALEDALDHADAHGLPIAYAPVQVHLPRRSVGVPAAKAA